MAFDTSVFDSLLEPTFLVNQKGKVLYCNEVGALLSGISARRLMRADSILDVFFFDEAEADWASALPKIQDATPYRELSFKNSAGTTGKVQVTIQPFDRDEKSPTWLVYFRDVTLEETLQKKYRAELDQKEGVIKELQEAQLSLENYSKNLEKMVEDRTQELQEVNRTLSALLDSLGQGFFIFNSEGACLPVFSKACLELLECNPSQLPVWDILKIAPDKVDNFKKWIFALFSEMLPFEDIAALAPRRVEHSQGREIALSYYPIRSDEGGVAHTVVMASDVSAEVHARKEAEVERSRAKRILAIASNLNRTHSFIRESQNLLKKLGSILNQEFNVESKAEAFRLLHTLKGSMATFSLDELKDLCHEAESSLSNLEVAPQEEWQKVQKLSRQLEVGFANFLIQHRDLIGEELDNDERKVTVRTSTVIELIERLPELGPASVKEELVQRFLLEPVGEYFTHYQSMIRDIALEQGKSMAPLRLSNSELAIYGPYYESLFESFVHLFRNSIDHGIELPKQRAQAGKPEHGQIDVGFSLIHENGTTFLQIQIKDDGAGIDVNRLAQKLQERGIDTTALSNYEILQHVFVSELSTRDSITELSGRGVGMDAVLDASRVLGGSAWVESVVGEGTTTTVIVPYTLPFGIVEEAQAA